MVLRRPWIIPHLIRAAWAFRASGWYRRAPFLPVPSRSYTRWRMETAYGDPDAIPSASEMERYLVWSSQIRQQMKGKFSD